MSAKRIVIKNGTIVPFTGSQRVIPGGMLLIEGNRIREIKPTVRDLENVDVVIDAAGKFVLPGLINAHMHFYSTFARGIGGIAASHNFRDVLENLWWKLDRKLTLDDVYLSAVFPMIEAIRHGTTTIIDHHASPFAIEGSLDTIARAVTECGLRAALCYEVSDRDGPEIAKAGIAENVSYAKWCRESGSEMLKAMLGMHASFTLSDATLDRCAQEAHHLGIGLHVHTAEAKSDQDETLARHGMRVVERFKRHGILGPKTICAHCVHVDSVEMEILAATNTNVVHNPQSNANNAVGVANLIGLVDDFGIPVGLGTDAMTLNMFEELRHCVWAHKLARQSPSVGFMESVNTLVKGNLHIAEKLWGGIGIGLLREGGVADVAIFDYESPTPVNESNLAGHLVFGLSQAAVDTTICAGEILMQDKKLLLNFDEALLAAKARVHAADLWKRMS